jgi:hypothetical protein
MNTDTRACWLEAMLKISLPVLEHLANDTLKENLPDINPKCHKNALLEAFGRTVYGISPWLELEALTGEEKRMQDHCRDLFHKALKHATDPSATDYMIFGGGEEEKQPLVDAAFLCNALLRAPKSLIHEMEPKTKEQLIKCLIVTRKIKPLNNNWVLFSAMVETGLYLLGADYDKDRIGKHVHQMLQWYVGDGLYGDGDVFHFDYYNSFVIQPMLLDLLICFKELEPDMMPVVFKRSQRYAAILERMISPEGTYPMVGRSICYRFGAFQTLSQMALFHGLPEELSPAQVRCGLTAVIKRMMEGSAIFDENGWLVAGVCGRQPDLAERYINTGSLYLCTAVFLVLGLSPEDPFWTEEDKLWTAQKIFSGQNLAADKAIKF